MRYLQYCWIMDLGHAFFVGSQAILNYSNNKPCFSTTLVAIRIKSWQQPFRLDELWIASKSANDLRKSFTSLLSVSVNNVPTIPQQSGVSFTKFLRALLFFWLPGVLYWLFQGFSYDFFSRGAWRWWETNLN